MHLVVRFCNYNWNSAESKMADRQANLLITAGLSCQFYFFYSIKLFPILSVKTLVGKDSIVKTRHWSEVQWWATTASTYSTVVFCFCRIVMMSLAFQAACNEDPTYNQVELNCNEKQPKPHRVKQCYTNTRPNMLTEDSLHLFCRSFQARLIFL